MKKLKCLIIEDNEIDRLMMLHLLGQYQDLEVLAALEFPDPNSQYLQATDVIFLDIDLPNMSGIEFRKMTMEIPACVFVTSHPEHALEAFESDTFDFISKPLKKERLDQTINRLVDYFKMREKSNYYDILMGVKSLNIKEGHDVVQLNIDDVKYLEALKDYTRIITYHKNYCVLKSIGTLLKDSVFENFVRIHKSFAVPKHLVTRKSSSEIILENQWNLPVGRAYKANLDFFDV